MQAAMRELGPSSPATALHHESDDPDGGNSGIVYDKGAIFLRTIEQIVGRPRFDAWLRSYFDRHAFEPMTSARFLADLRANLVRGDRALENRLELDRWVYEPGVPDNAARPDPAAFAEVDAALRAFEAGGPAAALPFARWNWAERVRFLKALPRRQDDARLAELDRAFGLSQSGNSEVLYAWLRLALANRYAPALPAAEHFLAAMGRMRFVVPIFQALVDQGEWGRPVAVRLYAQVRPSYHSVTRDRVDRLLQAH
jgi:leukotriene-A4 hydrolase